MSWVDNDRMEEHHDPGISAGDERYVWWYTTNSHAWLC